MKTAVSILLNCDRGPIEQGGKDVRLVVSAGPCLDVSAGQTRDRDMGQNGAKLQLHACTYRHVAGRVHSIRPLCGAQPHCMGAWGDEGRG